MANSMPPPYSSPTVRTGGDFPPVYGGNNGGRTGPMSPIKVRLHDEGFARHDSPMGQRESPAGGLSSVHRATGNYQPITHHMQHPPPPPYGAAPPPAYEDMLQHHSPMGMMPPPPPSYQEAIAAVTVGVAHGSRHDSPNLRTRASPGRGEAGTPVSAEPPAYNARYRHDPYSPEGSRVVSPNRRDLPASPIRQHPA